MTACSRGIEAGTGVASWATNAITRRRVMNERNRNLATSGDVDYGTERPLADRLRTTLHAARGNVQIRERLRGIIADPARFEPIVRELGPRHALVRELLAITGHGHEGTTPIS
jgi:hypothetical protein